MSVAHEVQPAQQEVTPALDPKPQHGLEQVRESQAAAPVLVRRRAWLHAVLGLGAAALATGYVLRALSTGGALAWDVAGALAVVALWHLAMLIDARSPLLVADGTGVRVRAGRTWQGLRWANIDSATVSSRRGLRDGEVTIRPVARADDSGACALTVRLAIATVTTGDLDAVMQQLARAATTDPEAAPSSVAAPAQRAAKARPALALLRSLRPAARTEITNPATARTPQPSGARASSEPEDLDRRTEVSHVGQWRRSGPGNVSVLVDVCEQPVEIAEDWSDGNPADDAGTAAILGPQIRTARERLGMSVDDVANRTRIRAHVIEALEVDDFEPCGGDFYARGHIRALSRVVGIDAEPLVSVYDERYSAGPISPRTVFQADFATGPSSAIRRGGGGPQWVALIATVLVLTMVWGVARIVFGA